MADIERTLAAIRSEIGGTPFLDLSVTVAGHQRRLRLKLEGRGATGSVKGRTAVGLLEAMHAQRPLASNTRIVESTSGNLGIALARYSEALGIEFTAVVDPMTTPEAISRLTQAGARLVKVSTPDVNGGYLRARLETVARMRQDDPDLRWPDQYGNPAAPAIHAETTAPEIDGQCDVPPQAICIAISTGGCFAGISRWYRIHRPRTRLIGVDVRGSQAYLALPGVRCIPGIGAGQRSRFLGYRSMDAFVGVNPSDAVAMCHWLARTTGVRVGGSSGAVLAACIALFERSDDLCDIVCLCADGGEIYESTIYNPTWLEQRSLVPNLELPITIGARPSHHRRAAATA